MNNQSNQSGPSVGDTRIVMITKHNGVKVFYSEICSENDGQLYWSQMNWVPHADLKEAQAYLDRHHGNKTKSVEYIKYP